MNTTHIQAVGKKELGETPLKITKKPIGICNEVYEISYPSDSYILRMNQEKEWIYGTHKFLPLFQQLNIKTPQIIAEDYSKTEFPFCYQILTKLAGKDMGLVIHELSPANLKEIAGEISFIFDQFNTLPSCKDFGGMTGLREDHKASLLQGFYDHKQIILQRNASSQVLDQESLDIYDELLKRYEGYFVQVQPRIYYDDICSKNVMIHEGKFQGLVDLDFLAKGDYLQAIGHMRAVWQGEQAGDIYIDEIIRRQRLNNVQQEIIQVYAILTLILWTSEAGIQFNSNSTTEINWENVKKTKRKIMELYRSIQPH